MTNFALWDTSRELEEGFLGCTHSSPHCDTVFRQGPLTTINGGPTEDFVEFLERRARYFVRVADNPPAAPGKH